MADAELLRDLRERVLDESESLVGLLRTCLALGAVTGSDALRSWASRELKGYESADEVPAYRRLQLPLYLDSISLSNVLVPSQPVSRHQAPPDARPLIPSLVSLRSPVEHLRGMAESGETHQVRTESLKFAAAKWNLALGNDPQIVDLYYKLPDTAVGGVLSVVRTTLVEMVMDMAQDVPLDQLPTRRQADAAVQVHVDQSGDQYHVSVHDNKGVVGQGPVGSQTQHTVNRPIGAQRRRWGWLRR